MIFFVSFNVEAQTPEDIWQEYRFLKPPFSELIYAGIDFEEPYYSLSFKEFVNMYLPPEDLIFVLTNMVSRLPNDFDYLFREFWNRLSLVASKDDMMLILIMSKIDKLPADLSWFVDDVAQMLLRRETEPYVIREVACHGPRKYRQEFLEKFFSLNPSSRQLASSVLICDEKKELFLRKLLNHHDLDRKDLINVLVFIDKYPTLYDQYFSRLLMRQNEFDANELEFIRVTCKTEPYCSFFQQFKFSAVLERRQELLKIMQKR